ncbi:MAG: hypothetical protein PPP56_01160 [Longimonas sp.]|uniref:hypothetical protein n=1 Tax=Longimonas sp. TaxID=2039626 RepID=UPI003362D90B
MAESKKSQKDTGSAISLIDILLIGFGLFLMYMAVGSYAEGDTLGAGADLLLGIAGVLMGMRNPVQHSLQRPVPILNTAAIVCALTGIVLFGATFFQ